MIGFSNMTIDPGVVVMPYPNPEDMTQDDIERVVKDQSLTDTEKDEIIAAWTAAQKKKGWPWWMLVLAAAGTYYYLK